MYTYKALVFNIVDGDTIDLFIDLGFHLTLKERVRLLNINAPEIRTKDLEEKSKGILAKDRLSELVLNKQVIIETHLNPKDKYGRILANIYVQIDTSTELLNINELLISEGLAVKYEDK